MTSLRGLPSYSVLRPPGQSDAATTVATSGTIFPTGLSVVRLTTGGAVTGVILDKGSSPGQTVTLVNESGNSITMAAAATSNVADGTSAVLAANRAFWLVWDTGTNLWYRS